MALPPLLAMLLPPPLLAMLLPPPLLAMLPPAVLLLAMPAEHRHDRQLTAGAANRGREPATSAPQRRS